MGGRHAPGHLSSLRNKCIADTVDQKLFQIPEVWLDNPVDMYSELCLKYAFDSSMDLGWAHAQFDGQAIIRPGLVTEGDQFQKYQDVLWFEWHNNHNSRIANKE